MPSSADFSLFEKYFLVGCGAPIETEHLAMGEVIRSECPSGTSQKASLIQKRPIIR